MPITQQGMGQPDLDTFLRAIATLQNELKTDRTTSRVSYKGLLTKLDADATVGDSDYAAVLQAGGTGDAWPADPTAAALVVSGFTAIDMSQEELYDFLVSAAALQNELRTDRTTQAASIDALLDKLDADSGVTDTNYSALFNSTDGSSQDKWPADPTATAVDISLLSAQGISQPDLVANALTATQTLCNELRTDRGTQDGSYGEILDKLDADGLTDTDYAALLAQGGSGAAWPATVSASALDISA